MHAGLVLAAEPCSQEFSPVALEETDGQGPASRSDERLPEEDQADLVKDLAHVHRMPDAAETPRRTTCGLSRLFEDDPMTAEREKRREDEQKRSSWDTNHNRHDMVREHRQLAEEQVRDPTGEEERGEHESPDIRKGVFSS